MYNIMNQKNESKVEEKKSEAKYEEFHRAEI